MLNKWVILKGTLVAQKFYNTSNSNHQWLWSERSLFCSSFLLDPRPLLYVVSLVKYVLTHFTSIVDINYKSGPLKYFLCAVWCKLLYFHLCLIVWVMVSFHFQDWRPCSGNVTVPWLEISIDGCRIWPIARNIRQKSLMEVSGLKIDGCMHPLPKIDGCSCTRRTRTNQVPVPSLISFGSL